MTARNRLLVPVVLLLVGAGLVWIASRTAWLDVVAFNDQSGEARRTLVGADWQPALVPLALGALAAVAAVALVRGTAARAVGVVVMLLGIAVAALLTSSLGEVDRTRVHSVVTSEEDLGRTNAGPGATGAQSLPDWSVITDVTTRAAGPAVAGSGALALLAAGLSILVRPAPRAERGDRYVTPAARRSDDAGTRPADPDTGRGIWAELDEGRDPTA